MLLITWCSRDSSTPKFLPGEDHPHASYDTVLVAFSFSDNNQLPSTHCQKESMRFGPVVIIRLRFPSFIHPYSQFQNSALLKSLPLIYAQMNVLTCNNRVTKKCVREQLNTRSCDVTAAFHNLMRGDKKEHLKHINHKETYDCCIKLVVVILTGTSEYNLGLLITSFPPQNRRREWITSSAIHLRWKKNGVKQLGRSKYEDMNGHSSSSMLGGFHLFFDSAAKKKKV